MITRNRVESLSCFSKVAARWMLFCRWTVSALGLGAFVVTFVVLFAFVVVAVAINVSRSSRGLDAENPNSQAAEGLFEPLCALA
jgi:hypothetical protein